MLKNRKFQILLLGLCAVMLIAVWLGYHWLSNPESTFEIMLPKEEYTQSLDFSDLELAPGESKLYEINFTNKISGENDLEFTFEELSESPLAEYIYVEISIGDNVLCDTRLDILLNGHSVRHTASMKIGEPLRVDIRCYMPESVTNEAQGKTASVRLNVVASNEKPIGE